MENKGKAMMIVIIVLLSVLIISIFGVSFYALSIIKSNGNGNEATVDINSGKVLTPAEITTYELAEPIAVNLAAGADGRQHSMSVEVGIGIDNTNKKESPAFLTLIQSQEVVVRDVIISVLRTKTVEEMQQLDSQEAIKQEILDKLRAEFGTDLIYSVYFGTFYYD